MLNWTLKGEGKGEEIKFALYFHLKSQKWWHEMTALQLVVVLFVFVAFVAFHRCKFAFQFFFQDVKWFFFSGLNI